MSTVDVAGRIAVVTGAAHGIGAAMARRFAAEGAAGVVVSDLDIVGAEEITDEIVATGRDAIAVRADVGVKDELKALVRAARTRYGGVDIFCANAGVAFGTGVHAASSQWELSWSVNVMQHVHAAQLVLPAMARAGHGCFLITASAAGLLTAPGDAPYSVSKHAAVGLAEWLALTYRPRGVVVSALCPLGVRTDLLEPAIAAGHPAALAIAAAGPLLEPDDVAACVIDGIRTGEFLILPHESVRDRYARKAAEVDKWLDEVAQTGSAGGL